MHRVAAPFRHRHSRRLLAAWSLSALGNGAGHVALMLVAYHEFDSAWAVALVLLGGFAPAMLFGPQLGALADRWSRRWCAAIGEAAGGAAFLAMPFVDKLPAFVALAALAGAGSALFYPAVLSGLPSLVPDEDVPAATAMFSTIEEIGFVVGPLVGALLFATGGTDAALLLNAATFVVAALTLATLPLGGEPEEDEASPGVRASLGALRELPAARSVVVAAGPIALCFGLFTAAEVVFATDDLGLSASAFSLLAAVMSIGMAAGALAAPSWSNGRRVYVAGIAIGGIALLATASAGALGAVMLTYLVLGAGNGAAAVQERLLLQREVPTPIQGCAFGARTALSSWGMALAYVVGGAAMAAFGARPLLAAAGIGLLAVVVWLGRTPWTAVREPVEPAARPHAAQPSYGVG